MTAPAANAAPTNDDAKVAQEVGMMFAHEYYTFLNKEPSRLHCFYNKNSTLSHGLQGENVDVTHGQQAIHSKILDLDFEDCKVLVSNVDCQRSLDGSIIIQVLGELSNRGGPAQKFAQTFFLAVQPKGFYVLNDIFRYLKDDIDEYYEEAEEEQEHIQEAQEAQEAQEPERQEPEPEVVVAVAAEPVAAEAAIEEAVIEKVEPVEEEKEKIPALETKKSEKKTDRKSDKKSDKKSEKKDSRKEAEPEKKEEVVVETAPAPVESTPAPETSVQPPKPAAPKTWANLAASNPTQWGSHVSAAKATSVNVLPTPTPAPKSTPAQAPKPVSTHRPNGREEYHSIYIKNVTEKMTLDQLREAFTQFGTVKHLELTRGKTCAFLDFSTPEAMHAALKQNTVRVGSETVLAEERHRNNSNGPQTRRPFNNTTNGHGSQGAHRGRGGSIRGGASDRKPAPRPSEKSAPTVAVK
ncbi:hypothetical protein BGZ81_010984 [Podila clonocystis]|nr:hypothetical protein BGZ81_010984 [Podila clonocystis]